MLLAGYLRRMAHTGRRLVEKPMLSQPRMPKNSSSSSSDNILEKVLKLQRAERQKMGTEKAFQAEIDHWLRMWTKGDDIVVSGKERTLETKKVYERKVDNEGWSNGTGRRKSAVAQVWIRQGTGLNMTIRKEGDGDSRLMTDYFDRFQLAKAVQPLKSLNQLGHFDMNVTVYGGGLMGQAGAVSLGLARALQNWDPIHRSVLKEAGLLTRDARVVERKKPGQKKARKKFQWVKR